MDLVRCHWRDAHFDFDDAGPPIDYIVETVGFLLADGPVFISIAAERLPDGSHRAVTHIPKECCIDLEAL